MVKAGVKSTMAKDKHTITVWTYPTKGGYKNKLTKTTWKNAVAANYVQFDLYFRVKDINGQSPATYLAKNLYLTDLTIQAVQPGDSPVELNLYKAVRVHFATNESSNAKNNLFAYDADSTEQAISTNVYGNLDLNNNGKFDKGPGYEWDSRGADLVYGDANKQQVAKNICGDCLLC